MIQYSLYLLTTTIVKNAGKIRIIFSKSLTLTVCSYADYIILLFDLNGMEKLYFDYSSIFKNTGAYTKTFIGFFLWQLCICYSCHIFMKSDVKYLAPISLKTTKLSDKL